MVLEKDIVDSIQIPELIKDTFIKQGNVCLDKRNRPLHYSGGFALVFPFVVNNEKWAFRCWKADLGNIERRLSTLSQVLKKIKLSYFCDFTYSPEGICVNGRLYPTTRMKWIDGYTLKDYLSKNPQSDSVKDIAAKFLQMCKVLHEHHIAHGDLQHGNIMIDNKNNIYLIDYDSVYTPQHGEQNDIITGLIDYQHPARKNNKYASEKLDYFSELIIYISLLAIAEDSSFIQKYDIENTEYLLFTKDDYVDLKSSTIYKDLFSLGGVFPLLLFILEEYLSYNDVNKLEPFDELLDKYTQEPVINNFIIENTHNNIAYKNTKLNFYWDIDNYSFVKLNGKRCNNHKYSEVINADTKYVLEVTNGLKTTSAVITIKVVDSPIIKLILNPSKIKKGKNEHSQLSWNIKSCASAKLIVDGNEKNIKSSGKEIVNPTRTTTYEIQCVGLDIKTIFSKKVTLYVLSDTDIEFTTNKQYTYPHIPVLLSWKVEHAKFVELVGYGNVEHEGTKIVDVEKDTVFKLKVTGAFGVKTKDLLVRVLPLPMIKSLLIPTPFINQKINVNLNQTFIQPLIGMPKNIKTNISIPPLIEPHFKDLSVKMIEPIEYHPIHVNLDNNSWWNKIWNRIKSIKSFKN